MYYVLDIHTQPPCIVFVNADADKVREVGQRYADQVMRDLVVAEGPRADEPSIRPTIAQAPLVLTPAPLVLTPEPVPPTSRELAEVMLRAPGAPTFATEADREAAIRRLATALDDSKLDNLLGGQRLPR